MRTFMRVGLLLALASGQQVPVIKKLAGQAGKGSRLGAFRATARPDLAGDLASVAQLKLASRKTRYRVGEIITADLAIINISDHAIFLPNPRETPVTFMAEDRAGKSVPLFPYREILLVAMPEAYQLAEPDQMTYASFRILAGRDDDAFRMEQEKWGLEHSKEPHHLRALFDRGLFVNWGDAYLDTTVPGIYTITAEYSNQFVIVDPANPKTKTATGTIVSSPLTITIGD